MQDSEYKCRHAAPKILIKVLTNPHCFTYMIIINTIHSYTQSLHIKAKGKAIPLQAWRSPEGSRRLRLPDFKTIGT
jgi:hypothetical protein